MTNKLKNKVKNAFNETGEWMELFPLLVLTPLPLGVFAVELGKELIGKKQPKP